MNKFFHVSEVHKKLTLLTFIRRCNDSNEKVMTAKTELIDTKGSENSTKSRAQLKGIAI
jgi:hypothetical protein